MKSCGKVLCVILSFLYLGILDTSMVDAAKNAKRSGSKSKSKKKNNKKKNNKKKSARVAASTSSVVENESEEETVAADNTSSTASSQETQTVTVTESTTSDVVSAPLAQAAAVVMSGQQNSSIESDAQWESFKFCMHQACSGGDDQPDNVNCYKTQTFDSAFLGCKSALSDANKSTFEAYFKDYVMPHEQEEFCRDIHHGTWKDGKCALKVVYKRQKIDNECLEDCSAVNEEREWVIDGKNHTCSAEAFGVKVCYKDSPNCSAVKMKKVEGWMQIGTAALTGTIGAISAVNSATITKEKTEDGKTTTYESSNTSNMDDNEKKELTSKKVWGGVAGALQGASSGLATGTGALIEADMMSKEKGDMVWGSCHLSNGDVIQNNGSKMISW